MAGARAKGVNEKKATKIFDLMEYFAGYGFNKSHSTAYAFLAYQTAYLKANYPWHFAAALLTIESQNTDKLAIYLAECRERGVPVLAPDINASQLALFGGARARASASAWARSRGWARGRSRRSSTARDAAGRPHPVAARAVRDPGPAARQQARVRGAGEVGRLRSLLSGGSRRRAAAQPARAALSAVDRRRPASTAAGRSATGIWARPISSAAATSGGARERRGAAGRAGLVRDRAAELREGVAGPLLERAPGGPLRRRPARPTAREATADLLPRPDADPDATARSRLPSRARSRGRRRRAGAEDVSVGGIVSGLRPLKTRKGDRMCVFMLDDARGSIEVVVFPETFKQCGPHGGERPHGGGDRASSSGTTRPRGSWPPRSRRSRC